MKATDIQIGDWLQNTNGNTGKVGAIYRYPDHEKEYENNEFRYEVVMEYSPNSTCYSELSMLKPIPLTAEILEKNGFTRSTRNGGYYLYADESYSNQTMEIILFHVDSEYNSNQLHICYAVSSSDHVMLHLMSCNHVHELQHALRLCGIEKEIEL